MERPVCHGRHFVAGDYLAIKSYRQMRNPEPQLILNEKGMQVKDGPFMEWHLVSGVVVSQTHIRYSIGNLSDHSLDLGQFDKNAFVIEKCIQVYMGGTSSPKNPVNVSCAI